MPLFDNHFLTQLEYLSLVSRKVFQGQLMAQRRTTRTGSGIEFSDHRQYTPGDDFRYLDWNLYARHDELLLKRFQEEEDLHVYLLLDCSRSMSVGRGAKFDLARQVAAALAYIALSDLDQVAIYAFADGILHNFPLARGKGRILSLMEWLTELQTGGQSTHLKALTSQFLQPGPRPGLALLLSDCFDSDGFETGLDMLRHHRFETSVIQLHDAEEANPRLLGDVELQDIESGISRRLTVTEASLQRYRESFAAFLKSLRNYCSSHGMDCTISTTDVPFDQLVLAMMRADSGPGVAG
ncbi:MAG: DUF58 domain-containing protein [Planctomycetaceae bacterium]